MEHVKYYNEIRLPYDKLIKKAIIYANPTDETKTIYISTPSPFIKIKNTRITVKPYSNSPIQLRLYFDRTSPSNQRVDLMVSDANEVEHLIFHFLLA